MSPFSLVFVICCFFATARGLSHDWEDPTDIFGYSKASSSEAANLKDELMHCKDELDLLREGKGCRGPRVVKQRSVADYYIQRLINLLLASADFKNRKLGQGHEIRVNVDMYFNSETLPVLQAFGSGDTNGHAWSELDTAFIKVFSGDPDFRGVFSGTVNNSEEHGDSLGFFDDRYHLTILIAITGGFALCVIWVFMIGGTRSIKPAIFVGSVLVFSFCFGWTFWSESQDMRTQHMIEVSKSAEGELPDFCMNPSSGLFGWFLKASREQECIKFLKARNLHHMTNVDIAVVFRKTLQAMLSWIPALSHSASEAFKMFYGDSFTGYFAKLSMVPMLALVGLLALFVFLLTKSTFRIRTLLGEVSYGHQSQQVDNPAQEVSHQRQEISFQEKQINQISDGRALGIPAIQSNPQPDQKKQRERGWWFKSKPKYRLKRSETSPMMQARNLDQHVRLNPQERLPTLALKKMPKRRMEEKAFRDLRRAYSTVEPPLMADL